MAPVKLHQYCLTPGRATAQINPAAIWKYVIRERRLTADTRGKKRTRKRAGRIRHLGRAAVRLVYRDHRAFVRERQQRDESNHAYSPMRTTFCAQYQKSPRWLRSLFTITAHVDARAIFADYIFIVIKNDISPFFRKNDKPHWTIKVVIHFRARQSSSHTGASGSETSRTLVGSGPFNQHIPVNEQ